MKQGTGQPERLHCTGSCQCSRPPGHCCLQIDRPTWPTKFRCLNSGAKTFVFRPGIGIAMLIRYYYKNIYIMLEEAEIFYPFDESNFWHAKLTLITRVSGSSSY